MKMLLAALALVAVAGAGPELSVEDIVAKHIKARGGLEKIHSIETLRQTGQIRSGANRTAFEHSDAA